MTRNTKVLLFSFMRETLKNNKFRPFRYHPNLTAEDSSTEYLIQIENSKGVDYRFSIQAGNA